MVAKKRLEERFHDASYGLHLLPEAAHAPPASSLCAFPTVVWDKEQNEHTVSDVLIFLCAPVFAH